MRSRRGKPDSQERKGRRAGGLDPYRPWVRGVQARAALCGGCQFRKRQDGPTESHPSAIPSRGANATRASHSARIQQSAWFRAQQIPTPFIGWVFTRRDSAN